MKCGLFFFVRSGCLVNHTKHEANNSIKPQRMRRKFVMPYSCVSNEETVEFLAPWVVPDLDEAKLGNIEMRIYEEETAHDNTSFVSCEDDDEVDGGLIRDEDVDDVCVAESIENMNQFCD